MRLNEIAQAPVSITIEEDGKSNPLNIPKFELQDFIDWGSEVDSQRETSATRDLEAVDKFKLLSIYPMMPTDMNELESRIRTPAGIKRVLETCLKKAGKDPAFTAKFIRLVPMAEKEMLVARLTDLAPTPPPPASTTPPAGGASESTLSTEGQEQSDPLPRAPGA